MKLSKTTTTFGAALLLGAFIGSIAYPAAFVRKDIASARVESLDQGMIFWDPPDFGGPLPTIVTGQYKYVFANNGSIHIYQNDVKFRIIEGDPLE